MWIRQNLSCWVAVIATLVAVTIPGVFAETRSDVSPLLAGDGNATANVPLRIMSIGASTAWGVGVNGSSYRKTLRGLLVAAGNTVDMVGEVKHGDFDDNECEAFAGFVLDQISQKATLAVPKYKPNLVLLDAGGNDCNGGQWADSGDKMKTFINTIFSGSPGVTIVLQTLNPNSDAKKEACRVGANTQFRSVEDQLAGTGAKIGWADTRGPDGLTLKDIADGTHPNQGGYEKMANVWFKAIQTVISKGFLTAPS